MKHRLLSFFLLFYLGLCAQNNVYNKFIHLSNKHGLSQSSVIAIEQDSLKQIWIGTRDGLNKYDGDKFTVYKNNTEDTNSISNNDILSIKEDNEGFLWVGTHYGLNKYNPKLNTFTSYFHSNKKGSIANNTIWKIALLNTDQLWFGTSNGLMIYDREKDNFITIKNNPLDPSSLAGNHVLDIYQDQDANIWVATTQGLDLFLKTRDGEYKFKHYNSSNSGLKDSHIQSIIEDENRNLWIGTKSGGLYKSTLNKGDFTRVFEDEIDKDIRSLAIDNNKNLWIATYNGLYINSSDNELTTVKHQDGNFKSLSRNVLKTIFIDVKGSVWIGAYYGGINLWDKSNANFISLYKNSVDRDIEYGVVSTMVQSENGTIYFGTEGKGVSVLNPDGTTNDLILPKGIKLPGNNIKSLFLDGEKLWIGMFNVGIIVYDIAKKDFDSNVISPDLLKIDKGYGVYAISKIEDQILIGTFGEGLIIYKLKNKEYQVISNNRSKKLSNDRIRIIKVDSHKNIWVGTQDGLNFIDNRNIKNNNYTAKRFLFNEEQLSGDDIFCVFETKNKEILVGTKDNGLYVYNGKGFKQFNFNIANTIINSVYSILEDDNSNLWLSTNKGIIKYSQTNKKAILYNQSNNFTSNEFTNNSCLKNNDGKLFFGGPGGVSYINPNNLEINDYSPQVLLTGLKIEGKEEKTFTESSVLQKQVTFSKALTLDYMQRTFSINFAIPNFINTANNKYKYRLVGLNNDWQFTKNTEVNYTIQKPGNYRFEVKGGNSDNIWNETPTVLNINIKPAPWRTIWAFLGYGLIIAFAFLGLSKLLQARAKLEKELELEYLESERIKQDNQSKLDFFTNISHEFRTPLALIIAPLQQIITTYKGNNKIFKKLLIIDRNANQLLTLINQLLDFKKFEDKHSKLQVTEGDLPSFLKEIYLSFNEFASLGNYTYNFESQSDKILVYFDSYKLERVFYNLISNAFKYTPEGGEILIKLYENETEVIVEVNDNGKGIDANFLDKIFDRFYEAAGVKEYQKHFNQGSGIGLFIAKKAIDLHKGIIQVKSTLGKGSSFTVKLKKGKEHLNEDAFINDFEINENIIHYKVQLPIKTNKLVEGSKPDTENTHTLLIAEDNEELRQFMKEMLEKFYHVIEASNGEEAYKEALKKAPDLIISDVIMPKMEGTELCFKIKNDIRTSHIPLILLTSRTSLVYKLEGLEYGADAYINKPFNVNEFLLTVKNMLNASDKFKEKFSTDSNFKPEDYTVTSLDEELLKRAIKTVEDNMGNSSFDIPTFSTELGVSRTMLFNKVKGWTNLTPNEFIHSIRMKRAAQLLEIGEINVSEVCYKVGFKNPKYFTKRFKKHFQLTPSEYSAKFY